MTLIDGKAIAEAIRAEAGPGVLAIVVPTRDESTAWYVRTIVRTAEKIGITTQVHDVTADELFPRLDALAADPGIHGVICQTPLPDGVTLADVGARIPVEKDVDGANPVSLGNLAAGLPAFAPATAQAVLEILRRSDVPLEGRNVVVVGRSNIVGKPAALLLLAENATVTVCHSRTVDLAEHCRRADVLVAAVGRAHMLGAEHVKPGAVVIDVGTNPTSDGGLVGDVDTAAVESIVDGITPVPGGVGPVTTAVLLRNVAYAASR